MQNRGLRISLNVRMRYPVHNLHIDTNVDSLDVRFDIQLLSLIHKYMYGGRHDADELGLHFQKPAARGRVTRSTNKGLLE